MRLGKLSALTGVILIAIALIVSCSDNNTSTSSNFADIHDPAFVPVQAQINDVVGELVREFAKGFGNLSIPPGDNLNAQEMLGPAAYEPDPSDVDNVVSTYAGGWYHVTATYTGDFYNGTLNDSIQFLVSNDPVEFTSSPDDIHFINNYTFTAINQNINHTDYSGRTDFLFEDLNTSTCTINGGADNNRDVYNVVGDSSITNEYSFTVECDNIIVNKYRTWESSCPSAGTVTMTLTHSWSWNNGQETGSGVDTWTVTLGFNDGEAIITVANGTSTWRYHCDVCTVVSAS